MADAKNRAGAESDEVTAAHRALVAKVDAFDSSVRARRALDMQCKPGCSACCVAGLTVSDVEARLLREGIRALDAPARVRLTLRAELGASLPSCVFLEGDGRCAVYAQRPMVCRTQGLPLRYPDGVIPDAAIYGRSVGAKEPLTWCPLNFIERAPLPADVLDAERVDRMVALSNRDAGGDPERRTALLALALEIERV